MYTELLVRLVEWLPAEESSPHLASPSALRPLNLGRTLLPPSRGCPETVDLWNSCSVTCSSGINEKRSPTLLEEPPTRGPTRHLPLFLLPLASTRQPLLLRPSTRPAVSQRTASTDSRAPTRPAVSKLLRHLLRPPPQAGWIWPTPSTQPSPPSPPVRPHNSPPPRLPTNPTRTQCPGPPLTTSASRLWSCNTAPPPRPGTRSRWTCRVDGRLTTAQGAGRW